MSFKRVTFFAVPSFELYITLGMNGVIIFALFITATFYIKSKRATKGKKERENSRKYISAWRQFRK
jgi:uncharacterized BrkB/YihY/UPF0761 family membrane protein